MDCECCEEVRGRDLPDLSDVTGTEPLDSSAFLRGDGDLDLGLSRTLYAEASPQYGTLKVGEGERVGKFEGNGEWFAWSAWMPTKFIAGNFSFLASALLTEDTSEKACPEDEMSASDDVCLDGTSCLSLML